MLTSNFVFADTRQTTYVIAKINIPEEKIQSIKPYLKTITLKIDKERYLQSEQVLEEAA